MKKNKSLLLAIPAIALMIGGGFLLSWTINSQYGVSSAFVTLSLALLALFIYVAGATLMGRSLHRKNALHPHDGLHTACNPNDGTKFILLYSHHGIESGVLVALLLIAAGALLICFNTGLLSPVWKGFFFCWPMLLFVIGAVCLCNLQLIAGFISLVAGIFFLLEKASVIYPRDIQVEHIMSNFWPTVFIVAGIVIILTFIIRPRRFCKRQPKGNWNDNYVASETENKDGKINYRFIFSGTEQVILDPVFKGGTIDVTFGGMDLDLRRTTLAEGSTTLYVNAVFGGVEIKAPDTWNIEIISKSFAGGVNDERLKYMDVDRSKKLVIYAKCSFGGITIS